jgi:aminodeoxyfutalosine synthase
MNLNDIINPKLRTIAEKVANNIPVNEADACCMLTTDDILDLGTIANYARTERHGKSTFYGVNMNLNYTNVCELRCPLCAYSCDKDDERAFLLSLDEIGQHVRNAVKAGIDEVHIVGGLNPELKLDYFEEMLRKIKSIKHDIVIVAFTAVEYDYFAKLNNLRLEDVFKRLIEAGLDALPGGGAEIFSPHVRNVISPKKISGDRWLEVMKTAHQLGLKTNATMLYNQLESIDDIVDHLFRLRALQHETNGFKAFVPLLFHEANTQIKAKSADTTGYNDIRIYTASRIILHNIPHIKALWMYLGEKMAQLLLRFGVDELGGTYQNEKVVHAAGAGTPDYGTESFLVRLIKDAGLEPVRTTALYRY